MKKNVSSAVLVMVLLMFAGTGVLFVSESNAKSKTYRIGDKGPAGGWIFYDKGNSSDGWRYLEAAPNDQSAESAWGCYEKSIPGAQGTAIGTGKTNTAVIIGSCDESGIAAKVAADYRGGGKSDWFLPSDDELNLMYHNLHIKGIGGFAEGDYWSSSEGPADGAAKQNFIAGGHDYYNKVMTLRVRAVRAF